MKRRDGTVLSSLASLYKSIHEQFFPQGRTHGLQDVLRDYDEEIRKAFSKEKEASVTSEVSIEEADEETTEDEACNHDEEDEDEDEDEEDDEEDVHGIKKILEWIKSLNLTVLAGCIIGITALLCLCFPTVFFKILLLLEAITACGIVLHATKPSTSLVVDKRKDGYEFIPADENGKKLSQLIMQKPVEELHDLVAYLKNPEEYEKIGYIPEMRWLIVGGAGFGKEALIRAFANETNLHTVRVSASRFAERADLLPNLFQFADIFEKIILQIDSFDRLVEDGSSYSSPDTALDSLKAYLDAYDNVILLATCEDPATLASNESFETIFKEIIILDTPEQDERVKLLREFTSHLSIDDSVNYEYVAKNCIGFSIGEIKQLVSKAISSAHKAERDTLLQEDFLTAYDLINFGNSNVKHSQEAQEWTAYHESGHALVSYLLTGNKSVLRVISTTRGDAGGLTYLNAEDQKEYMTANDLKKLICTLYGGICAEKIRYGCFSAGGSTDISKATSLITSMVKQYGMSNAIGLVNFAPKMVGVSVLQESSEMQDLIAKEITHISKECEENAIKILEENRDKLDKLAHYLIDHESITGDEMEKLLQEQ